MSGYNLFVKENQEGIRKRMSTDKMSEVMKQAGEQWSALGDKEKEAYNERAKKLHIESEEGS